MSDMRGSKSGGMLSWEERPPLWWAPIVMVFMSIILGICCLFYMSTGGVVFCILHCVAGSIFAGVTFWAYMNRWRVVLILAAVLNAVSVVLLFCTFVYTAWQLGQNARAKNEAANETYTPLVSPLLLQYFMRAEGLRRLSSTDEGGGVSSQRDLLPPLGLGAPTIPGGQETFSGLTGGAYVFGDLGGAAGLSLPRTPDASTPISEEEETWEDMEENSQGIPEPSPASASPPSPPLGSGGDEGDGVEGDNDESHESGTSDLQLYGIERETEPAPPPYPGVSSPPAPGQPGESSPSKFFIERALDWIEDFDGGRRKMGTTLSPSQIRRAEQAPEIIGTYILDDSERECLSKALSEDAFAEAMSRTATALLDRRLFCGFTRFRIGAFKKWHVSCDADCMFDKLAFAPYRNNEEKSLEKVREFVDATQKLDKPTAQLCVALLQVTACKIEDQNYIPGVISALSLGLIFSFLMCVLEVSMTVNCFTCMKNNSVAEGGGGGGGGGHDVRAGMSSSAHA